MRDFRRVSSSQPSRAGTINSSDHTRRAPAARADTPKLFTLAPHTNTAAHAHNDPRVIAPRDAKTNRWCQRVDRARCLFTRWDGTRPDRTGSDRTRPDQTRPDQTRPGQARPGQTTPGQTRPDQVRPHRVRPDQTRPGQTNPDWTRPDQTGPDRTRPDQTGPDQN